MESSIKGRVRVGARPNVLVGHAVEVIVQPEAAADLDSSRLEGRLKGRREAEIVVPVHAGWVADARRCAVAGLARDGIAVLEVPDLVREGGVVRMRRPRYACVLAGCAVCGVERTVLDAAGGRAGVVDDVAKVVGHACGHRARLAAREVVDN